MKHLEVSDLALGATEHAKYRTAVGKLLGMAFVRRDCSFGVEDLSHDVKGQTQECHVMSRLKHLLRYIAGAIATFLRLNRLHPAQMLEDWLCVTDVTCYVDNGWAGCHKTRPSTSGSIVQVLGDMVTHTSRTQAAHSGEAELYAIGQGINEALFVKFLHAELDAAGLLRCVRFTPPSANPADVLTKCSSTAVLSNLISKIGLVRNVFRL